MVNEQVFNSLIQELDAQNVALIAVSKFKSTNDIAQLYALGQRDFGENYVQELVEKNQYFLEKNICTDIRWHFIGHLQRNKVKYIASFIDTIHGVDSLKLLQEINKEAAKHNRIVKCLLQFHIAEESSKFGLDNTEAFEILEYVKAQHENFKNIAIVGVMGMASFSDDTIQVQQEFKNLNASFHLLKTNFHLANDQFKIISMGMSNDYALAIQEGSTMVRIGSLLFGKRN